MDPCAVLGISIPKKGHVMNRILLGPLFGLAIGFSAGFGLMTYWSTFTPHTVTHVSLAALPSSAHLNMSPRDSSPRDQKIKVNRAIGFDQNGILFNPISDIELQSAVHSQLAETLGGQGKVAISNLLRGENQHVSSDPLRESFASNEPFLNSNGPNL